MIALITPTGGRPRQFELCNRWMSQQTYKGKVLWVIVDDCVPFTTDLKIDLPDNWVVVKKHPQPYWKSGQNTQARNLKVGINTIKAFPTNQIEAVFIIEDDDYYSPLYLETMMERFEDNDVLAESFTIYYHVGINGWHGGENKLHASLFQVAFKPTVINVFEKSLFAKFIDKLFFANLRKQAELIKVKRFKRADLSIGIKGLNGRNGIGMGHDKKTYRHIDKDKNILKKLLKEDHIHYVNT